MAAFVSRRNAPPFAILNDANVIEARNPAVLAGTGMRAQPLTFR